MSFIRFLGAFFLLLFTTISIAIFANAVYDIVEAKEESYGTEITLIVIFLPLALFMGYNAYLLIRRKRRDYLRDALDSIRKHRKITVGELSVELGINSDRAKSALDELCDIGACEMHLTPEGGLLYSFRYMSNEEKARSYKPEFGE